MKHPLSGLPAPTAGRAAARAAAALLAGCGPSHDAPANAGQASAKAQQNGPASVAVARGKIEVEGGLLDLSPAVAGVVQQLSVKEGQSVQDRKSTRLNSSHLVISYAVFCLKKKTTAPTTVN